MGRWGEGSLRVQPPERCPKPESCAQDNSDDLPDSFRETRAVHRAKAFLEWGAPLAGRAEGDSSGRSRPKGL